MSKKIEDYALIGDRRSAALVGRDGSIDWLCWPRFDSHACFAALLGGDEHGHWRLAPRDPATRSTRRYRPDTLILETRHTNSQGSIRVLDFMPIDVGHSTIVRRVIGEAGEVDVDAALALRFDYGKVTPWIRAQERRATAIAGPDLVILRSDVDLCHIGQRITAAFRIRCGECVDFVMRYGLSFEPEPPSLNVVACLAETERYWVNWLRQAAPSTTCPAAVSRSLITLQALVHGTNGGILAAPTMGLPEIPGGAANWDYRYCWLRDSTFTLSAFLRAGFRDEALSWRDWLLRAVAGDPVNMRTMYRCDGGRHIETFEAPWLPGYDGAQPVHVGNVAAKQMQLDIYGEVLDSLYVAERQGIGEDRPWNVQIETAIVDHIEKIWQQPDQGIWEFRGEPRHFTYSKVMAWAGVDRFLGLRVASRTLGRARRGELERLRDTMHARICRDGFSASCNRFTASFGTDTIDASLLRLPLVGFLPASDARIAATIEAVERELVEDGLVRRWRRSVLQPDEGAFLACTCWLADCLLAQGRVDEARGYFERVLACCNDVGLLAEEWDPRSGRLMGNFPQALSHLALVNTALQLDAAENQR